MKISVNNFKGEIPIVSNRSLPDGCASLALNCNLVSSDLAPFFDIGNPYQLAKTAPINTIFRLQITSPTYWYQWSQSEVAYGTNIDVAYASIPDNTNFRTLITGLAGGPRQTNLFYGTDPSQQGSNTQFAYPYVTFPLGIANPVTAPTVAPGAALGTSTPKEYAQPISANNVAVVAAGTGYVIGDILTLTNPSPSLGLPSTQLNVAEVDPVTGAITSATGGAPISVRGAGFYPAGTTFPASTPSTGGHGTGATFAATSQAITFNGFTPRNYTNTAGTSYITWTLVSATLWNVASAQGDLTVAFSNDILGFKTAATFLLSADAQTIDSGTGDFADLVVYFLGTNTGDVRKLAGPAVVLSKSDGTFKLTSAISGTNGVGTGGPLVAITGATVATATYYRITVTGTAQSNTSTPGFSVIATYALQSAPATILGTITGFVPYNGEQFGVGTNHRGNHNNVNTGQFQNIYALVTQAADSSTSEETSYLYTYETAYGTAPNAIDQESGPSPPSATVLININSSVSPATLYPVQVSIPAPPTGQFIDFVDLYRLVQQTDGSEVYQFVAEIPATGGTPVTYTDTYLDAQLGAALATEGYSPPASNLEGIIALPNGVAAGFFGNTLSLSTPNFPFSFPVENQYNTDSQIVGLAAIDTTVLILTQSHPYTAFGSDPSSYTMTKETSIQGCVSKRSIATHKRFGVVYASSNGPCYYRGQGDLDLLRTADGTPYFSYEQWQQLNPSSIIGQIHDDCYYFWYVNLAGVKGCYILDLRGSDLAPVGKFGLTNMDVHATAPYVDPLTDQLYFTPDMSTFAVNGSVVSSASNIVSQWEGNQSAYRSKTWSRAEYLLDTPSVLRLAQINAEDFTDVQLTVSNENGTLFSGAVTSARPFITAPIIGRRYTISLTGLSVVNTFQVAESESSLYP